MLEPFRSHLLLRIRHNLAMRDYNATISNVYSEGFFDLVLYTNTQSTFMILKNNDPKLVCRRTQRWQRLDEQLSTVQRNKRRAVISFVLEEACVKGLSSVKR